jgi:PIN domain nuclease of toxin-antitoxin system
VILLDTPIWVRWLLKDTDPLSEKLVKLIDEADEVGVTAVSCWEVCPICISEIVLKFR